MGKSSSSKTIRDIVLKDVVPKLREGAKGTEGCLCYLSAEECRNLIFILKTSIQIEPFISLFSQLTHEVMISEDDHE